MAQLDPVVQRARRTQLALQDAAQLVSLLNEHSAASNRDEIKKLLPRAKVAAVQPNPNPDPNPNPNPSPNPSPSPNPNRQ